MFFKKVAFLFSFVLLLSHQALSQESGLSDEENGLLHGKLEKRIATGEILFVEDLCVASEMLDAIGRPLSQGQVRTLALLADEFNKRSGLEPRAACAACLDYIFSVIRSGETVPDVFVDKQTVPVQIEDLYTILVPVSFQKESTYTVSVPYTEQVEQVYQVSVPVTRDDGTTYMVQEHSTRMVPVTRTRMETRTRMIPVVKMVPETRSRTIMKEQFVNNVDVLSAEAFVKEKSGKFSFVTFKSDPNGAEVSYVKLPSTDLREPDIMTESGKFFYKGSYRFLFYMKGTGVETKEVELRKENEIVEADFIKSEAGDSTSPMQGPQIMQARPPFLSEESVIGVDTETSQD